MVEGGDGFIWASLYFQESGSLGSWVLITPEWAKEWGGVLMRASVSVYECFQIQLWESPPTRLK